MRGERRGPQQQASSIFNLLSSSDSAGKEAAKKKEAVQVQHIDRHKSADGPRSGSFVVPAESGGGVLTLRWDNTFSYLRSKEIRYSITPEGLLMTSRSE